MGQRKFQKVKKEAFGKDSFEKELLNNTKLYIIYFKQQRKQICYILRDESHKIDIFNEIYI